jgi:malonate-semialdehyde dehydrogenase (acetylating)/methylmalonate-semialdehyde dehydrogenase
MFRRLSCFPNRISEIIAKAKNLHVNEGMQPHTDLGPLISPRAKQRVENLIQTGINEGATLALDGRGLKVINFWAIFVLLPI